MSAQSVATAKLAEAFIACDEDCNLQLAVVAALGRVGGLDAANRLAELMDTSSKGSPMHFALIKALGEVGRHY